MPELQRRKVSFGLEQFAKRLQVLKAQLISDLADGEVRRRQLLLG
jgi:hypothetical protein